MTDYERGRTATYPHHRTTRGHDMTDQNEDPRITRARANIRDAQTQGDPSTINGACHALADVIRQVRREDDAR